MTAPAPPFATQAVEAAFAAFPPAERAGLGALRRLIFAEAAAIPGLGGVEETLKWRQPAYRAKGGSTLRLGLPRSGGFALCTHCRTTILSEFREMFPHEFTYEGNRAIHFATGAARPVDRLALDRWALDRWALDRLAPLVRRALSYHRKTPA